VVACLPHEPISTNFVEYMIVQIAFLFANYGTTIVIRCNSLEDGDNGHTKTIKEA
jgi:hypothetical protein